MRQVAAGSRKGCPKKRNLTRNHLPIWEPFVMIFLDFRGFLFQCNFSPPGIPNFTHFGVQRDPNRRFSGNHFEAISRVVAKVRMSALVLRGALFLRFWGAKKANQHRRYFRKGFEVAWEWHFSTLLTILGVRRGSKRSPFWSSRALFLMCEISMIFDLKGRGPGEGPAAEGGAT